MNALDAVGRVSLSPLEFDVLTEYLRLPRVPLVLKVPSPGRTYPERARLVESAWRSLGQRGLRDVGGLDPDLERMLHLLAAPEREVDGRLWLDRSVRVLAATDAERAVLVTKEAESLALRPASPTGLPREAVSVLPPLPAGPGRSVSVRSTDLDAAAREAGESPERLPAELRRRGVRADDAEGLAEMVAGATSRGQFGAAARQRDRRERAERVIGFFDTAHGRYAQLRRRSPSGEDWSTIAPADDPRLIGHLAELLDEVTDDRDHSTGSSSS
ncbi:ESX secretion-associated protein EspG [Saccharopolyspora griseoalba]|uniref:ESX secretion-associated protein EspG n=1 Tax=Saccharopolyspora griseoalba TaxID=1431848 RepID=A0ABW2LKW4_9PSEU